MQTATDHGFIIHQDPVLNVLLNMTQRIENVEHFNQPGYNVQTKRFARIFEKMRKTLKADFSIEALKKFDLKIDEEKASVSAELDSEIKKEVIDIVEEFLAEARNLKLSFLKSKTHHDFDEQVKQVAVKTLATFCDSCEQFIKGEFLQKQHEIFSQLVVEKATATHTQEKKRHVSFVKVAG
jgi:hypothetical protein